MALTPLNWKEVARLAEMLQGDLAGLHVDKVQVPERPRHPLGYIKGEWVIRLGGRRGDWNLVFSIRPRFPYVELLGGKGPRAAVQATHSPFSLALSKHLKGARLLGVSALPRERTLLLRFSAPDVLGSGELALALNLIPATPEALLVVPSKEGAWEVIARSRTQEQGSEAAARWVLPDGSRAPEDMPVRAELLASSKSYAKAIEAMLDEEAFALRLRALERELKDIAKQARDRIRQSEVAFREAEAEADWKRYGDLLKGSMGAAEAEGGPERAISVRKAMDYETGEEVEIPCDPRLDLKRQVEKFYQMARRKQRRRDEAASRVAQAREKLAQVEASMAALPEAGEWHALEKREREAGIAISTGGGEAAAPGAKGAKGPKGPKWLGKTFTSRDGLTIFVGRSRDENLELTFKHARGNDLWMHVRGRPGAHVVIPLTSGKSAPLETLLDAANLTVYYSGGEKWGKTEVDYTFKKHVKRIRDSTEASYTHNKTLIIEPDAPRLKRLLDGQS